MGQRFRGFVALEEIAVDSQLHGVIVDDLDIYAISPCILSGRKSTLILTNQENVLSLEYSSRKSILDAGTFQ